MSTNSQSRLSIDLGAPRESPLRKNKIPNHPPRLQHSPSLPNIWFPPHSGPIPLEFEAIARSPLQRPSTPPFEAREDSSPTTKLISPPKTFDHRESLSFDDFAAYMRESQPLKIQRRRRVDRDHGHSLLTPPLTPSSSLRTTTSIESVGNNGKSDNLEETRSAERDINSTRFLLLRNVSRQIPGEALRASIVDSLTSTHIDPPGISNSLSIPNHETRIGPLHDDSIKGVFLRCQQSSGIAMLAFFDVRQAEIAKKIISVRSTGPLAMCAGDAIAEDGTRAWISCQFITAEELVETIGNSQFLASTDGTFYLAVEGKEFSEKDFERQLRVVDDRRVGGEGHSDEDVESDDEETDQATLVGDNDINLTMLQRFLASFGGVRSFSLVGNDLEVQQYHPNAKIFHVEYYDVREADSAYTALDGQVLFAMKLKVFGREVTSDQVNRMAQPQATQIQLPPQTSTDTENYVSFPNSNYATLHIGPPGQHSQTRERFLFADDTGPRARRTSAGQDVYATSFSSSPVPSPTYFYTSNFVGGDEPVAQPYNTYNRPNSSMLLHNTPRGPQPPFGNASEDRGNIDRDRTNNHNRPDDGGMNPWQNEAHLGHGPNLYGSHHDCYYCPSRASHPETPGNCYASYSTPSPFYYELDQHSQPPLPPFVPPAEFVCEQDASHSQPLTPTMHVNMANWAFEHAMMTVPRPIIGDWFLDAQSMVSPGLQAIPHCLPQMQVPSIQNISYLIPSNKFENSNPVPQHSVHRASPLTGLQHHARAIHHASSQGPSTSNAREPQVSPERNQLNLARIEDGQDTRTTVMVKNIPNKMSDKDLVAYIGKVSPRKIDFLYLRMDFQNGCNVGYAFVNFITVEDLLQFAKKKLGEKWNMFSSEKVLQMSYANYQGKEALVEKFKNSCIMDEREAWRPKIFYSEPGPEQGLPEPFPAPTHLRRKERSSYNRGALYIPSVGRGLAASQVISHIRRQHSSPQDEQRPHTGRRDTDRGVQNVERVDGPLYSSVGTPRRRTNAKFLGGPHLG